MSDDQIDLTWDASTDNVGVTGYNIYRDNLLVDTSPTNAYSDTGLASETEYEYEVSAFDAAANESYDAERDACYNDLDRYITTREVDADGLLVLPITPKPNFYAVSASACLSATPVSPDTNQGGLLVNVVDYQLAS